MLTRAQAVPWFISITLILAAAALLPAHQSNSDETRTSASVSGELAYKFSNGRTWKGLDKQTKIMMVDGIEEGIFFLMREVYASSSSQQRALTEAQVASLTVSGFHMSDIVQQIDRFYGDSSNLRIPVVDAYTYSMKKIRGAKQQDLENYEAKLRQTYNN